MRAIITSFIIVLVLFIIGFTSCTERIDAGHEGIVVKLYGSDRGVQDISLASGRVWYNPLTEEVYEFPTFVQTVDYEPFTVNAKDGSVFTVDPTVSYYILPGASPKIFAKYRKDIHEITMTTLYNYVKDAYRIQMNKYTTDELISNREKFENDVQATLDSSLNKDGFKLEQLTSGLTYPEAILKAIDAKNRAVQEALQVENELKITEAQAKKKIIEAEAEAKANLLRQQSLTPLLIQQQFIEKWNGKTPLYFNSPVLFQNLK
jgi:regulator of protease activity HflC (stomatin/prohibitin superfamily)